MAKDPSILWYWNDWQGGTITMTRFLKGCYMDLLHAQFNSGPLSLEEIKTVLGSDFSAWGTLSKKFKANSAGNFFNERLEQERNKRAKFTESRRNNLKKPHMGPHMENENENENEKKEKGVIGEKGKIEKNGSTKSKFGRVLESEAVNFIQTRSVPAANAG